MPLGKIPAATRFACVAAKSTKVLRSRGISSSSFFSSMGGEGRRNAAATSCKKFRTHNPQPPQNHPGRRNYSAMQQRQLQNHPRRRVPTEPRAIGPNAFHAISVKSSSPIVHHSVSKRWHGGPHVDRDHADSVHVTFVDSEQTPIAENVDAYVGESLLQVAQRNDIELEGACEGVCACSTCHVIFPDEDTFYNLLEEASEDEEDMLDMAYGLTETSRLSCQILVTSEMEGMMIEIPKATRNFYVDGHVPQPH